LEVIGMFRIRGPGQADDAYAKQTRVWYLIDTLARLIAAGVMLYCHLSGK
jgi:hypothetical protein